MTRDHDETKTLDPWVQRIWVSDRSGKTRCSIDGEDRPGHVITTSAIASIDGDTVTTYSGTVYRLGQHKWPKMLKGKTFAECCEDAGVEFAEVKR